MELIHGANFSNLPILVHYNQFWLNLWKIPNTPSPEENLALDFVLDTYHLFEILVKKIFRYNMKIFSRQERVHCRRVIFVEKNSNLEEKSKNWSTVACISPRHENCVRQSDRL